LFEDPVLEVNKSSNLVPRPNQKPSENPTPELGFDFLLAGFWVWIFVLLFWFLIFSVDFSL
jgi:hypothetical protein